MSDKEPKPFIRASRDKAVLNKKKRLSSKEIDRWLHYAELHQREIAEARTFDDTEVGQEFFRGP